MSNILTHANDIVNNRSEEKERMYGPFFETMERATRIYNEMNPQEKISTVGMYKALVALKLAREAYHHKEDNLLDAVAYMGSMNDYIEAMGSLNDYIEANTDAAEQPNKKIEPQEKKQRTLGPSVCAITYKEDLDLQAIFDKSVRRCRETDNSKIILHGYKDYRPTILAESHIEMDPEDGKYKPIVWYNKVFLDELNIKYYGKIQ